MVHRSNDTTRSSTRVHMVVGRATLLAGAVALWLPAGCLGDRSAVFACENSAGCAPGLVCDPIAHVCVTGTVSDATTTTEPDTTDAEVGAEVETLACADAAAGDRCTIDGACFAAGSSKPGEPCLRCRPSVSTTDWTPADSGPCDDGNVCTPESACVGGTCQGTSLVDLTPCPGATTCAPSVCISGACEARTALRGTVCAEDGGDSCAGDGRCVECLSGEECDSTVCASDGRCDPGWPFASDTLLDKVVTGYESIAAGSVLQVRNLTIAEGGVLDIVGSELRWTIIGVRGTLRLDGRITGTGVEVAGTAEARGPRASDCLPGHTPCTLGDLGGEPLVWTMTQAPGGDGGRRATIGHGTENSGNGGGGSGGPAYLGDAACQPVQSGSAGTSATSTHGGDGGLGYAGVGTLGLGATSFGQAGATGRDGGGGGGGKRGRHGQPLYIKVLGEVVGHGTVALGGEAGGPGGAAEGTHDCDIVCVQGLNRGSGGGGGAGGNGGALALRGAAWPDTISLILAGGAPGVGGVGGVCDTEPSGGEGQRGADGPLK